MYSLCEKSLILLVVGFISSSSKAFQPSLTTTTTSLTHPSSIEAATTKSNHNNNNHPQHHSYQLKSTLNALPSNNIHHYNDNNSDNDVNSFAKAVRNGWQPDRGSFSGLKRRHKDGKLSTVRSMADTSGAIMPDGGLSPCIIKVVGVGGGGCNAVSILFCTQI